VPDAPIARSPIQPVPPTDVRDGWAVSALRSHGALQLGDRTPMTKLLVRASVHGRLAERLDVPFGRSRRDRHGTLIVGSGPDEWHLLAPPNTRDDVSDRLVTTDGELVSVVDVTHGRALMRLSGADALRVLAKVCAIDLADDVTPDRAAFRSSVAKVATDVVRDDLRGSGVMGRSYLLHCERSSGQYLFDALLDAGREFGIEVAGFSLDDTTGPGR
jgi:sarcosine oxidase, subunit alpha